MGGAVKRVAERLNRRVARIAALPKPTGCEGTPQQERFRRRLEDP